jgi:hypothetical protein
MTIKHHKELEQGSDAWYAARLGLLTASEMDRVITVSRIIADIEHANNPKKKVDKLKRAKGEEDKEKTHVFELAAQRITGYVEPTYIGDAMLRGHADEIRAKIKYNELISPLDECGFITNDKWGFKLGYSPDAMVRGGGLLECKSRIQKYQLETIVNAEIPNEFVIQVQTGLLVSEEPWCDFISYCGGMPMLPLRIEPDVIIQNAIIEAATAFHKKLDEIVATYQVRLSDPSLRLIPTERVIEQEITL